MEAVARLCRISIPLAELAGEAVDVLQRLVDLGWGDVGWQTHPCSVHYGLVHRGARRTPFFCVAKGRLGPCSDRVQLCWRRALLDPVGPRPCRW